jgi:diguanylate cyclase (GGDEF)-like protein
MKSRPLTMLLPANLLKEGKTLLTALKKDFLRGLEVIHYGSPEEAMQLLSVQSVDLVVLELTGEGREYSGLTAVARQAQPAIPVVCVAAGDVRPEAVRGQSDVVVEILPIPLEEGRMIRAVRGALRWRETSVLLRQREQELHVLDEIGRTIISSLELNTVLNIIMEKTRELVQSEAWSLLLVDEITQELHCSVALGEHADNLRQFKLKMGEGIAGWVAREGKPVVLEDVDENDRFFNEMDLTLGFRTRSILCVPLETRGKVLGVLEVINKMGKGGFTEEDLNLVTKLAGLAAIAIENARLYHQAKLLTLTDELTHLYNSRFFNQFLESEVKRCRRYSSHVALIFLDLDFFKKVNDQYGHLMGSKVLQEAADVLRSGLRDVDIVARYGGDEFLVILPETRIDEAAFVAERMRQNFEENTFLVEEGLNVKVTASFGVASFPEFSSSKEELVRFADKAMYRVKNKSRNGVCVADDPASFSEEGEGDT